jgi:phosphatidylinositol alpha-mannosyltransferase
MSRISVGLVSPYDLSVPGGVQAQVLGLARYLDRQGDRPVVIGPGLPSGVPGIDIGRSLRVPGNGSMVPISVDPRSRSRIRAAVSDLDLLHVHEPLMPLVSLFAVHSGPPVVATFHAFPGALGRFAYRVGRPLFAGAMGNTVAITAVSEAAASVLPSGVEALIIPNALDTAAFDLDVQRDQSQVAFLGRDERRKGLDVLLQAWPVVLEEHPAGRLVVMSARRDTPGVNWMGRVDEVTKAKTLATSAVFVAPQLGGESFGIVLLEAMAAGSAVIASDLGPFRAVATGAARFFPAGDSTALAAGISALLADPEQRRRLSVAGRDRAKEYDWAVVGALYRDLYVSRLA